MKYRASVPVLLNVGVEIFDAADEDDAITCAIEVADNCLLFEMTSDRHGLVSNVRIEVVDELFDGTTFYGSISHATVYPVEEG